MLELLKRLWCHIGYRRRKQFILLLALILLVSFAEIISIGTVLPYLGVLINPQKVFSSGIITSIFEFFGIEYSKILLLLTLAFCLTAIFAGAMRIILLWVSTKLSFAIGADLSSNIYNKTLHQPYSVHCSRNSSEIINGITLKANSAINNIIMPVLTLISSCIMLLAILCTLLAVDPFIAIAGFGGFGVVYAAIIFVTRKRIAADSRLIALESNQVIKSLQEGLGGIRDVLIDGTQSTYSEIYRKADLPLRRAQGNAIFIGASPRYLMESLGMLLIAALAYYLVGQANGINRVIPVLGALALGAQRMLPVLQQAYTSWVSIQGGRASLMDTLNLLDQPVPQYIDEMGAKIPFNKAISLHNLGFRYGSEGPFILRGVNVTIKKGSRVGIIGATGSGKSTLIDVVMGLLSPTEGWFAVDNKIINAKNMRHWQNRIAHVPQTIFLSDCSIEENIAFGMPKSEIDFERVRLAAKQAQISESIESWPDQYKTHVGERGVRLSGGQRQRIGIARALYKKADVIIFDEATSALDVETEQVVMQSIESLSSDLTLIIVAHRLSTLNNCNLILKVSNSGISQAEHK